MTDKENPDGEPQDDAQGVTLEIVGGTDADAEAEAKALKKAKRNQSNRPGAGKANKDMLTPKQRKFAELIITGEAPTASAAYRMAYDAENMSMRAINSEASLLMSHPKVAPVIEAGIARAEVKSSHTAASLRLHLEKSLYDMSINGEAESARLRALELLGKSEKVGFFLDRKSEVQEEKTPEQIEHELLDKLEKVFGSTG